MQYAFMVVVGLLLSACQSTQPSWVLSPNIDETKICAVGFSRPQKHGGKTVQKKVAHMVAKAEIGRSIELLVQTQLVKEEKYLLEACDKRVSIVSKQGSSLLLQRAYVTDEWFDERDETYYVQMCTQK